MIYQGQAITVQYVSNGDENIDGIEGVAELHFNLDDDKVNKFNKLTLEDLKCASEALQKESGLKGLIVTSGKESFIVGADITEFTALFSAPEEELAGWALAANRLFCAIEDLPCPTVVAINGLALGGGLEMCLSTDFRVMSTKAQIGLPEVKLGIFPGFGGTVRLPRLIGVDNAVEWIATGSQYNAEKSLADGVVDAVVEPELLRAAALSLVKECIEGKIDYQAKREEKLQPLKLPPMENMMSFQTCTAMVAAKAGRHYPAPVAAIKAMQQHSGMKRDQALEVESKNFAKVAVSDVAANLVGLFLNDQTLKKTSAQWEKKAKEVNQVAVLGAGIMGGGIAYQSAYKGTPIVMKDITDEALELGMSEATKLLAKRVSRKKMSSLEMGQTLAKIRPTLNYGDFSKIDIVIEAVVENVKIKKSVLAETESQLKAGAVLASNTSTISITELATGLQKPENFVGMHFFNPVHRMPLVEVIRGEKSSDEAVATTVKLARKMGKTPVVVKDCPGFLVNRVLFPYFGGFSLLLRDGVDFQQVDKVMEKQYGWPMGPAYLCDVIGIDTCIHAANIMAEGFPERMKREFKDAITVMYENKRFGQKNDLGFYQYEIDKKGKPKKQVDQTAYQLLSEVCGDQKTVEDAEIINRLMIPMCLETVRCLEEGIVSDVADADMALIMGLGFPPFRGGVFRYIDHIGTQAFVALCEQYQALGPMYEPTDKLREMAKTNETFYS